MTRFHSGPHDGKTLMLRRAPIYLRAVDAAGKFDALDQLEDTPEPHETLSCYVLMSPPGRCHILHRDRKQSGWYVSADYKFVQPQPTDDQMRETSAWRDWTSQQPNPFKK